MHIHFDREILIAIFFNQAIFLINLPAFGYSSQVGIFSRVFTFDHHDFYVPQASDRKEVRTSRDTGQAERDADPHPVRNIEIESGTHNVIASWQVPRGGKDYYMVEYRLASDPLATEHVRQVPSEDDIPAGQRVYESINDLKPGEEYQFCFATVFQSKISVRYCKEAKTKPIIDSVITAFEDIGQSIVIKYSPTPVSKTTFDRYRFTISDEAHPPKEKLQNDTDRWISFNSLVPGKLYIISVSTESGDIASDPIVRHVRLRPNPIQLISGYTATETTIALNWVAGDGEYDAYEIRYFDTVANNLIMNITIEPRIVYENLRPHQNYTFVLFTLAGYGTATMTRSTPFTQMVSTLESIPGRVSHFEPVQLKPNDITLQWSLPPREQHGLLTGFSIQYFLKGHRNDSYIQHFAASESQATIYDLIAGETYIFIIWASTKMGAGSQYQIEQTMPIWAPPLPMYDVYPVKVATSRTTIAVKFHKNFFADTYGKVRWYTIIVTEDDSHPVDVLDMPSWFDVHDLEIWPPYQSTEEYYPFENEAIEVFVVGNEDCSSPSVDIGRYCNGPLKPGTSYRFKVRAFTTPTKFTDTEWSPSIMTDYDDNWLYVGIIAAILLAIVIVSLALLKRCSPPPPPPPPELKMLHRPPSIHLASFPYHYQIMMSDSKLRFAEELDMLNSMSENQRSVAEQAELEENQRKNRYRDIVPNDKYRVKLNPQEGEPCSDYINASWVKGFNSEREFIVTQGPLSSTRDDFWRMVWERKSRAIVMLTRCVERGFEMCSRYWPENLVPIMCGDIEVSILNQISLADWVYTELRVRRDDQIRVIRHFQFKKWPAFGVPDSVMSLLNFHKYFRDKCLTPSAQLEKWPIIVHGSGGAGRSGTFAALDCLIQHVKKYDHVDIFGTVFNLRRYRDHLVQTEVQYILLHQAVLMSMLRSEESV